MLYTYINKVYTAANIITTVYGTTTIVYTVNVAVSETMIL